MRHLIGIGLICTAFSAMPLQADPFDALSSSHWAEACARSGTQEAEAWFFFREREWCEEFVGDHGRVISTCFAVAWERAGPSRWAAVFTEDPVTYHAELVSPNRLSIYEDRDEQRHQLYVLGRAEQFEDVATHRIKCK